MIKVNCFLLLFRAVRGWSNLNICLAWKLSANREKFPLKISVQSFQPEEEWEQTNKQRDWQTWHPITLEEESEYKKKTLKNCHLKGRSRRFRSESEEYPWGINNSQKKGPAKATSSLENPFISGREFLKTAHFGERCIFLKIFQNIVREKCKREKGFSGLTVTGLIFSADYGDTPWVL